MLRVLLALLLSALPSPYKVAVNGSSSARQEPVQEGQSDRNKEVVRSFLESVQDPSVTDFSEYLAPNLVGVDAGSIRNASGKKHVVTNPNFNARVQFLRRAFPDLRVRVLQLLAENDRVFAEVSFEGTQKGPFMGVAPTERQIVIRSFQAYTLQGGKISRVEELQNSLSWQRQLGYILIDPS